MQEMSAPSWAEIKLSLITGEEFQSAAAAPLAEHAGAPSSNKVGFWKALRITSSLWVNYDRRQTQCEATKEDFLKFLFWFPLTQTLLFLMYFFIVLQMQRNAAENTHCCSRGEQMIKYTYRVPLMSPHPLCVCVIYSCTDESVDGKRHEGWQRRRNVWGWGG